MHATYSQVPWNDRQPQAVAYIPHTTPTTAIHQLLLPLQEGLVVCLVTVIVLVV